MGCAKVAGLCTVPPMIGPVNATCIRTQFLGLAPTKTKVNLNMRKCNTVYCSFNSSSNGTGSMAENFNEKDEDYVNSSVVEAVEVKSGAEGFMIKMRDGRQLRCIHNNPDGGILPDYAPHPAIVLKMEDDTGLLLPIIVLEMPSVLLMAAIRNVQIVRPTLYQVVKEMVDKMGYRVRVVRVTKRVRESYFAQLYLSKAFTNFELFLFLTLNVGNEAECMSFDLRPSDAINIAVRCQVPIQVNKYLAYSDGMRVIESGQLLTQTPGSDGPLFTELDRPSGKPCTETKEFDLLHNMLKAVVEERYQDAASWRDKLNQLRAGKNTNNRFWCKKNKPVASIPGSRGLVFVGETLQFMAAINSSKGVYEFVRVRRLRYGNCFKTKLFGETHVFISRTESAKVILNNEGGKFSKKYIKSIAELVGSDSLLCAAQQHHKLIRCRLFNLFSTASLASFVKLFDAMVLEAMSSWSCGSIVVIQDETLKLACKAMCKMLISIESGYELMVMQNEVASICDAMLSFPLRLPGTRFYKGLKARKKIMDILEKEISERRSGVGTRRVDFLQRLLENENKLTEDEVPKLTDTEIKDNILTMMIAGQDTVANAMTWIVKFVDENQEVLNELMKEQVQIDQKGTRSAYLTLEALNEMPYASKVVKEALRMASVVQWFPRVALLDCEIEGFKIKKGWNINIDARSIHLDPIVHNDADVFNPSRFSDESKPYSFLAFGMGARTCLGKNMAKAMLLVFLHRLITTYKWKVIDSDSSIQKWALFTKLKSGCPVRLTSMKMDTNKNT
ncbi:unnamed protein product [Lupinus luteus]|uniref:BFN domain-containing protein n=1 Tax=Lupinus luteus TaxID=3873 RepID=A0AAV1XCU6_LUPLU